MANNVTESVSVDNLLKASESEDKKQTKNQTSSNTDGAKKNAANNKKSDLDTVKEISKKAKDAESDVYAAIDTSLAILGTLPEFIDIGLDILTKNSFNIQYSPLGLIFDLLNKVGVTDQEIIKFLVNFLIDVLPVIEIGVKGAILANIKLLVSCSSDPRIPKKLRKKTGLKEDALFSTFKRNYDGDERGMLIDLSSIDPEGILFNSPFSERGKNSYFGIEANEINNLYKQYGIAVDDVTSSTASNKDIIVAKKTKSKWELCRAEDKDAFLWFVIHQGHFPTPFEAKVNGKSVEINGQTFFDDNTKKESTSILKPMYLHLDSNTESSKLSVGSTIIDSGKTGEISLCVKTDYEVSDTNSGETRITKNYFLPLSTDDFSADWYIEDDQNFKNNAGFDGKGEQYDYNKQRAICNIQYMQPTAYKTTYVGGSTQKIRFTILPKPYVFLPYIDEKPSAWKVRRILFDEYGNPDSKGCFSLPTEKLTSDNLPYVRNENISPFTERLAVQNIVSADTFDSKLSAVISEIDKGINSGKTEDVKTKIINDYNSSEIDAFYLSVYYWDTKDSADFQKKKALYVPILQDCFNKRLAKEGNGSVSTSKYIKFRIGEKSDDCALYISQKTGDYWLGTYETEDKSNPVQFTKHLVRCYKGLTVYEFNYDFVMGMRLFSPKVVCAKLLGAATNSTYVSDFTVNINYSKDSIKYQYLGAQQIINEIVRNIVETEDEELTDCFYNFSNDEYDRMLNETEEKRFNQQPYMNDKSEIVDLSDVYEMLSNYPENGTKQEQKSVIENAITAATAKVSSNRNVYAQEDSSKLKLNFATSMLQQLVTILINSILSPKLLLLIAVNKQLMGDGGETFNIKDLLNGVKGLIVGIVKEVRDLIIQKLTDFLLDYLGPLAKELLEREVKERMAVYMEILQQLLGYFNTAKMYSNMPKGILGELLAKYSAFKGKSYSNYDLPTILDNVDYADIIGNNGDATDNDTPSTNNC